MGAVTTLRWIGRTAGPSRLTIGAGGWGMRAGPPSPEGPAPDEEEVKTISSDSVEEGGRGLSARDGGGNLRGAGGSAGSAWSDTAE